MTAAVLNILHLNPIVSEEELNLLKPWPFPAKIMYKRSSAWFSFLDFLTAHPIRSPLP
jgi:hypothetical protein